MFVDIMSYKTFNVKKQEKYMDEKEKIIKITQNCIGICSFVITLFKYLAENCQRRDLHKNYFLMISKKNNIEDLNEIDELISILYIIDDFEFDEFLALWINKINTTKLNASIFCYVTLLKIDTSINSLVDSNKFGTSYSDTDDYLFYINTKKTFFEHKLKEFNIRRGRQTIEYNQNNISNDFNSFDVVKKSQLNNYLPILKKYNSSCFTKNTIKIGVTSFDSTSWFNEDKIADSKEFFITYDDNKKYMMNKKIQKILMNFDDNGADIAIFPELVMNDTSEKEIKNFIIQNNFNNLKLIFLGSSWNNKQNEAILINTQGTILLRHKKKVPYKSYSKTDKCYYEEAIEFDNTINLVDIDGIGRIAYLICADYNDDALNTICSLMHTDFIFVSAYSNSTDLMMKTARDNASRKAISTILCNSCAARTQSNRELISFIVMPKIQNKRLDNILIPIHNIECNSNVKCQLCCEFIDINNS